MGCLHERLHGCGDLKETFVEVARQGNLQARFECCSDQLRAMSGCLPGGGEGKVLPEILKNRVGGIAIGKPGEDIPDDGMPPLKLPLPVGGMRGLQNGVDRLLPRPGRTKAGREFCNSDLNPMPACRLLVGNRNAGAGVNERAHDVKDSRLHPRRKQAGLRFEHTVFASGSTPLQTTHLNGRCEEAMGHGRGARVC